MIDDWPSEIVTAVTVRQYLDAVDDLYEYPLPEVAADERQVAAAERTVGPLDPGYRAFLTYANGWRSFLQKIDLFGTEQLLGATPAKAAQEALAALDDDVSAQIGFDLSEAHTIGASEAQTDLWLIGRPGTRRAGEVLWFWGSDFEDYPSFDEFFLAMVDYNRLELQRATGGGDS
jgi:hypothetical protein